VHDLYNFLSLLMLTAVFQGIHGRFRDKRRFYCVITGEIRRNITKQKRLSFRSRVSGKYEQDFDRRQKASFSGKTAGWNTLDRPAAGASPGEAKLGKNYMDLFI